MMELVGARKRPCILAGCGEGAEAADCGTGSEVNYYNELDAFNVAWLKELIHEGLIADGEVDGRDIREVKPADLRGYAQCHFFAGIGGWSYALRFAGWPDDRPVWTGSCPCPSFSAAGKGAGFNDPRHLWPTWFGLIRECRPAIVFGEQVDAAIGHGWLDLVQSDLEAQGYAVGAAVLGACSVGAPHRRQRLYFCAKNRPVRGCADAEFAQREQFAAATRERTGIFDETIEPRECVQPVGGCGPGAVSGAESMHAERWPLDFDGSDARDGAHGGRTQAHSDPGTHSEVFGAGNADPSRLSVAEPEAFLGARRGQEGRAVAEPGPTSGFWADCDWWWGRDGKWRPIEPGIFPLVDGVPARVGRLRGYGNAIVPQVAEAFIRAYMKKEEPHGR